MNNSNLFLAILRTGKSKIKELAGLVTWGLVRVCFLSEAIFSLQLHMAEWAGKLSGASFMRAQIPFIRMKTS